MARAWERTLEALLRERGALLYGYCLTLTGHPQTAEDVLHDALERTFRSRATFRSIDAAHAYVKTAISSTVIDRKRQEARRPEVVTDVGDHHVGRDRAAPDHSDRVDTALALSAALETLGPRERACVVLHYLDGLSISEISERLGIASGTVKRYLADGRTRLQQALPGVDFSPAAPTAPAPSDAEGAS